MLKYRPLFTLTAWTIGLVAVIWLLTLAGSGSLALPASSLDAWAQWADETSVATFVFALLRLVALVVAWYLLVTTVLSFVADIARSARLRQVSDAVTAAPVQRMTKRAVSVSLAGALALPSGVAMLALPSAASAATGPGSTETPIMRNVTPLAVDPTSPLPTPPASAAPTTAAPSTAAPTAAPPAAPAPAPAEPTPAQVAAWTVAQGDNLWDAAKTTLAQAWGTEPNNLQVAAYWRQLIEQNRSALVNPGNPSLIYPGQVFELPPVPDASTPVS